MSSPLRNLASSGPVLPTERRSLPQPPRRVEFAVTPFVQGEIYASRKAEILARLKCVRFKGLGLDTALHESVSTLVSRDVGERGSRPRWLVNAVRNALGFIAHDVMLRDLVRRPTLTIALHGCDSSDGQVWVLTDKSRKTVEDQLANVIGASPYAALELDMGARVSLSSLPRRILTYLRLYRKTFQRFVTHPFTKNHVLARNAIWAGDVADQARELFARHRPLALFFYRDLATVPNALMQTARACGIPTYSTQHAVHPRFAGRDTRVGNIVFENSGSDTYICWGEFSRTQMRRYFRQSGTERRLLIDGRPTSPGEQQLRIDKASRQKVRSDRLIVSLMGLRHEEENLAVVQAAMEVARRRGYRITVRPHPALDRGKYQTLVDSLAAVDAVEAELTDSRTSVQSEYSTHSLGVTGLTSTYYENLFFGIPVVFYDCGIELEEELPRVLPGVYGADALDEQITSIQSMTWAEWYAAADPVCERVYNRKCMEFGPRESMIELVRRDAGQLVSQMSAASWRTARP